MMKGLAFTLITVVFIFCGSTKDLRVEGDIHNIMIMHSGVSLVDSVECKLKEESPHADPLRSHYSMEVETVVCGDSRCKVDVVKLYWDALGRYERLLVPEGIHLEKAEGESFDTEDYTKLDRILADKKSSLRHVYKEEVVGNETTEGVDGMTGATIVVNTKDYVKGAVWTCYTLWHYAQGQASDHIQNITGQRLADTTLIRLLNSESAIQNFAIEQLNRKGSKYEKVASALVLAAPNMNYENTKVLIDYFENLESDHYYKSILSLLQKGSVPQRQQYFNSLMKSDQLAPPYYYESAADMGSTWSDYGNVNGLLTVLEAKNAKSPQIVKQVMKMLDNDNFLVARRAYYFLVECDLQGEEVSQVKNFQRQHNTRL